jgi:hypothetical protein
VYLHKLLFGFTMNTSTSSSHLDLVGTISVIIKLGIIGKLFVFLSILNTFTHNSQINLFQVDIEPISLSAKNLLSLFIINPYLTDDHLQVQKPVQAHQNQNPTATR